MSPVDQKDITKWLTVFNVLPYLTFSYLQRVKVQLSGTQLEDVHGVGLCTARPFYCCWVAVGFQF